MIIPLRLTERTVAYTVGGRAGKAGSDIAASSRTEWSKTDGGSDCGTRLMLYIIK